MKRMRTIPVWAMTIALGAISGATLHAQQKQEYVPQAESKKLVETALEGVPGKRVTIVQFTLSPQWVGGKHYHSGPVFVYVAKGALTVEETGKAARTIPTGEVYVEPVGQTMVGRNLSSNEPTEIVVFQVHGEGEALMYQAK